MAQIFISHSQKDKDLRSFFSDAFAGTNVKAVFEEFEKILGKEVSSEQIAREIEKSRALFVILSKNVQDIPHTRDWVVWETGVAKNKDIWIFEPYRQFGKISVVTPFLRHYAIFDINDSWLGYIRRIVESYDDSHILGTLLVTGGLGALIGSALAEDERDGAITGGILGGFAGLAMSDKTKFRPTGLKTVCVSCNSTFAVHIPREMNKIRCPVCNKFLEIGLSGLSF